MGENRTEFLLEWRHHCGNEWFDLHTYGHVCVISTNDNETPACASA